MTTTTGVRRIIAFNWPKLVLGFGVIAIGGAVGGSSGGPVGVAALAVAVASTYLVIASLFVSWWVYDRSDLHSWEWLRPLLPDEMARWVVVHAGFDESAPTLSTALGTAGAVIDISPRLGRSSRSLRRARRSTPAAQTAFADGSRLPLGTASLDAVLLVFAAHEVREAHQREALFEELRRVVRPNGRVVIVEHVRDCANVIAFGPGAWHFQPRREWHRLAARAGFNRVFETNKTEFVRGFALCVS